MSVLILFISTISSTVKKDFGCYILIIWQSHAFHARVGGNQKNGKFCFDYSEAARSSVTRAKFHCRLFSLERLFCLIPFPCREGKIRQISRTSPPPVSFIIFEKSLRKFFNDTLSTAGYCANFAQFCPVNCGLGGWDSSLILVVMVSQQLCKMI